jgi:hypothetical protein
MNVQDRTVAYARSLPDTIVIVDHGSYEIADVVAIQQVEDRYRVHLFHCKASGGPAASARLDDVYEVVGQGIRSARWASPRALWRELSRRVRERPGLQVHDRDKDEVQGLLDAFTVDPPDVLLSVWVVQPGLSRAAVDGWAEGQTLIVNAYDWCHDMPADLTFAISP